MTETFKQYRAVVSRPWSILDRDHPEGGPVTELSGPLNSKDPSKVYDLRRSEETHAYLVRWEERTVVAGDWCAASD